MQSQVSQTRRSARGIALLLLGLAGCTAQATVSAPAPARPVATGPQPAVVVSTAPRVVDGTENRVVRKHDYIHLRLKQGREFKSQGRPIDAALSFKDAHRNARDILQWITVERNRGTWIPNLVYSSSTGLRQESQILAELADLERVCALEYSQLEAEYVVALRKRYGVVGVAMHKLYERRGLYAGRDLTPAEICWKYGVSRQGVHFTEYHCFDRNGNPLRQFARPGQHY